MNSIKKINSKNIVKDLFRKRPYTFETFCAKFPQCTKSYLAKEYTLIINDEIVKHQSVKMFDIKKYSSEHNFARIISRQIFPQDKKILRKLFFRWEFFFRRKIFFENFRKVNFFSTKKNRSKKIGKKALFSTKKSIGKKSLFSKFSIFRFWFFLKFFSFRFFSSHCR